MVDCCVFCSRFAHLFALLFHVCVLSHALFGFIMSSDKERNNEDVTKTSEASKAM